MDRGPLGALKSPWRVCRQESSVKCTRGVCNLENALCALSVLTRDWRLFSESQPLSHSRVLRAPPGAKEGQTTGVAEADASKP